MKKWLAVVVFAGTLLSAASALAGEKSVTLNVQMWCPTSQPPVVQKVLEDVGGVKQVSVSFKEKVARVLYDDTQTDVAILVNAVADIGLRTSEAMMMN
jgi:mercuric ion binding protein